MVTLSTDRLILRPFHAEDFDAYADLMADAEVMRFIGVGKPLSRADAWRNLAMMLGHWQLRGYGLWAVEERATGELVGRIGCWEPDGWPGFEVGWTLRRRSWGRGFATEGGRATLHYAFTELKRPQIISLIHPANAASVRVAQRLGERLEGRTEVGGNAALIYGLRREDWRDE
jgi:RimJ/RimL family protein N-acetyltransferase